MAEPRGAWARPRPSASRTPQSRSSNASPNPSSSSAAAAATKPGAAAPAATPAPASNVWAARAAQRATPAAAPAAAKKDEIADTPASATGGAREKHVPVNGFNDAEVKEFLGRGGKGAVYKVEKSGGASSGKAGNMANGQSFFALLGTQVAALQAK